MKAVLEEYARTIGEVLCIDHTYKIVKALGYTDSQGKWIRIRASLFTIMTGVTFLLFLLSPPLLPFPALPPSLPLYSSLPLSPTPTLLPLLLLSLLSLPHALFFFFSLTPFSSNILYRRALSYIQ